MVNPQRYIDLVLAQQYEITEFVGEGGMGMVFRAYQKSLNREVAVKILSLNFAGSREYTTRFEREARTVATLEHPAIVPIHHYGVESFDDTTISYIVMRLLTGGSLADRIFTDRNTNELALPPLVEVIRIIKVIAKGLDFAHSRNVIHRDIKPTNILFDSEKNPYIVDFGISRLRVVNTQITLADRTLGTPPYMSPEQWGRPDDIVPASDQYSLAVLAFQMLSGRLPFEGESPTQQMQMHLNAPVPNIRAMRTELPDEIVPVFNKALSKQPGNRYPTVTDFARELERVIGEMLRHESTDEVLSVSSMAIPILRTPPDINKRLDSRVDERPDSQTVKENPLKKVRPTPGNARLVVVRAPGVKAGTEWNIDTTPFFIGLEGAAAQHPIQVALPKNCGIDPIHLQILYNHKGNYILVDNDTKTKTFLGRERLAAHNFYMIKPGSTVDIRLGEQVELRLIVTQHAAQPLPAVPESDTTIIDYDPLLGQLEVEMSEVKMPKQRWTVQSTRFTLGRNQECDACFAEVRGISSLHAVLFFESGQYSLIDQKSTNGTTLDGQVLEAYRKYPLRPRQTYVIGLGQKTFVKFRYE